MSCSDRHAKLWPIIKLLLMLSHGQVERGFFINNAVAEVYLSSHNLIARRLINDHVYAIGGLENLTITKELVFYLLELRESATMLLCWKSRKKGSKRKKMRRENHMKKKFAISKRKRSGLKTKSNLCTKVQMTWLKRQKIKMK